MKCFHLCLCNGISVAEMVKKLLKKNQELTLHMIAKDKQLASQRKVLEKLLLRGQILEKR